MISFKTFITEASPPSKEAEDWIKSNKEEFKKQYGEDWEAVLYATAWKMFGKKESINEEAAPTNTTDGVAMPDSKPLFTKGKFGGVDCIEVDSDTYGRCKFGKKPYSRWSNVIEDEPLRAYVQKHYQKSQKLMVMDAKSGAMTYIKR